MIIRCKTKRQFKIVLSFFKSKGLRWENGEDLEDDFSDEYWEENKSKIYLLSTKSGVVYGDVIELKSLQDDLDDDKKLMVELRENEKIKVTKENLNKIYLISELSK